APRRRARLRLPRARGPGRRARDRHRRGPRRGRPAEPRTGRVRARRPGAVRFLHARPRRCGGRSARATPRPLRRRDPAGAVRQPLPVHRLPEDHRGCADGGGTVTAATEQLQVGHVGTTVRRADAVPKVTGAFAYASDLHAAGMLWGITVRSPHPHALIQSIDVSKAVAMPGVHVVLTSDDVPGELRYGLEFSDQPVLAFERVRYFGEPVAILAAEQPEQARRAADAVRVDYELLEPVVDPERALERC